MNERKEGPLVENDMHFEVPGRWDSSMYPEIYGIPESLLFSLAHVTRLANEKDISNSNKYDHPLDMKQFFDRASSLEKYICAWRPPVYPPQDEHVTEGNTLGQSPHDLLIIHMITAFHKALLIFFYRRIYDVDASILQENVRHIQYLLSQCDKFDVPAIRVATTFVWVAFIASCEALDLTLQNWFSDWFDTSSQKANLPVFQVVKSVIQEVWRRRNKGEYGSWPVVLRETKQNLFYI
jgi:arginine metabolism regulation protein II